MRSQRKKKKRASDKIKLSNNVRLSLIFVAIILIAIGSGNLIKSLTKKTNIITEDAISYNYDNLFSYDAKINLKDNLYVKENEMAEGQSYLSDLISNIDMNIDYNYTASMQSEMTYSYKVEAIMKASYANTTNSYDVLNKVDTIKEVGETTETADKLTINDKVTVNYEKYHQTMKDFRQTIGITTDSQLIIRFTVNTKTMINSEEVNNVYVADYKISIGDKVAIIEDVKNDEKSDSFKTQEKTIQKADINYKQVALSGIILIIGLEIFKFILVKTEELKTIRNTFKLELNKILRSYEDKIVEIQDLNNFDIDRATKVKDIIQLRKLSEEAMVPIYSYIKEDKAYFIVSKYENIYIYILK